MYLDTHTRTLPPAQAQVEPCACFGEQSAPPRAAELKHVPALLGTMGTNGDNHDYDCNDMAIAQLVF